MKTNGVETVTHDVLIFGTGLAGLRAAVEIARQSKDTINMALISKVQIQRPHSVCAEGGSAAVMREEEGDSLDLHAWDTVKGSDFLADQDVVYKFVETCTQRDTAIGPLGDTMVKVSQRAGSCSVPSGVTAFRDAAWRRTRPVSSKCRLSMIH